VKGTTTLFLVSMSALSVSSGPRAQQPASSPVVLVPTSHPRVPGDLSQFWLVPQGGPPARTPALQEFAAAVKLEVDGNFAKALPALSRPAIRQGPLGRYAEYYKGLAELRLDRPEEARRTFQKLRAGELVGYLSEAAAIREADSDEALGDYAAATDIYEQLARTRTTAPDMVLMRLGRAATSAGDRAKAVRAFWSLYFDFPLSDFALSAGAELDNGSIVPGSVRYQAQLDRAERLFTARHYDQARTEFDSLRKVAQGDDRELVDLRVAECDYFLKRPRSARDTLRPYVERASRQAEALYFQAVVLRDLGNRTEFVKTVQRVVAEFATESWAEEALNSLATYEILQDNDERADEILREMYERFPTGRYAERAAWKIGWWAQRHGRYAYAARVFAKAAFDFPRSDYRPGWLYWSGRAHEALNELAPAESRYSLAVTDYLNTYYGRLAAARLTARGLRAPERRLVAEPRSLAAAGSADAQATAVVSPPNTPVIRALLDLELYDQAIDELRYAQKVGVDSPAIQATLAWISVQQGRSTKGTEQFNLLRGAINGMKRAYPQYLAAGGEELPPDILKVIFPIGYWDLIRKYAAENDIDPFVAAALIAQESTFVPDIKSYANAVGLTQLMPVTARQVAKTLKLPYSARLLTNPEANIRIGMAYLAAKVKEFGELHLALASYNAGERPVHRWIRERPGLERDEFIDDIPFPQTQGYVKKILGTAEDYRRLYGPEASRAGAIAEATVSGSAKRASTSPKATADRPTAKKASAVSRSPGKKKKTRKTA
jgi:soluble lytic murein transglycosylase